MARTRASRTNGGATADRAAKPPRRHSGLVRAILRHSIIWSLITLFVALILGTVAVLGATGRVLPAPAWIVARVEARANAALDGHAAVRVGGIEVLVDTDYVPHLRFSAVELFSGSGVRIAFLPDLRATLWTEPLWDGRVEPRSLTVSGARIGLTRQADGSLDLALGEGAMADATLSMTGSFAAIDRAFALPVLRGVEAVTVEGLDIRLDDRRTGQNWRARGAEMTLRQSRTQLSVALGFDLAGRGMQPARTDLLFTSVKGTPEADVAARVSGVSARDLAAQAPALAWLGVLDADISGSFTSGVDAEGRIVRMRASLDIGAGAVQPTPDIRPVPFDRARMELSFDPGTRILQLTDVAVDSPSLRVRAEATARLKGMLAGFPEALDGQVRITELKADPEGIFADPVTFTAGAVDLRLELAPFRMTIGQLVLIDGARRISGRGAIAAEPAGWAVSLDTAIDAIATDRLLALWPVSLVPATRDWLAENVATAELFDVKTALRIRPGTEPRLSLGYEYRAAEVRFLRTLPPVEDGAGYATIHDFAYTLVVDKGHVTPPEGGPIDVAGSVLSVPDIRIKPAPARVTLHTRSAITAALSLLDQPPFGFLGKAGTTVDLADGRAEVEAVLDLVLAKQVKPGDVDYRVSGTLSDVTSERIVAGRMLAAPRLALTASPAGIAISGEATLSGVPVAGRWHQDFGPEAAGRSHVGGTIELSPRFVSAFSIGLPEGAVSGRGEGRIALDLMRGQPTRFRLTSDLGGLGLALPEVGWTKRSDATGSLEVEGTLGVPPVVEKLVLSAPGLSVAGSVTVKADGGLDLARLDAVRLGDWFDGKVEIRGRGRGRRVAVAVTAGSADMRRNTLGGGSGGGGGGGDGGPVSVALDRLRVSETVALTGFRGDFTTAGGFSGQFTGRVNGAAPVEGTVVPAGGRSAFRIRAADAGAVLKSADIFTRGVRGSLDVTLQPRAAPGEYDGKLAIRDIRVTDAPVLAELLDAISVVGLLAQLNGPGIHFANVSGDFRLTPTALQITNGAAVGASMGISAAGVYDLARGTVSLQGTVSPIYVINSIGRIFARKGEGLFGFNYRLSGAAARPSVSVNPLSILTPGMFREIFRAAPPRIAE